MGRIKRKKIHVITTDRRPVPLVHQLFLKGKLFTFCDQVSAIGCWDCIGASLCTVNRERWRSLPSLPVPCLLCVRCASLCQSGRFQSGVCRAAVEDSQTDKRRQLERKGVIRHSHSNRAALSALLAALQLHSLLPTVVFAFSKRVCEDSAYLLHHIDLTSHAEKSQILVFFNTAIKRLHRQDRALPQVLHVKEMSVRGICTHHAGMLPILKEVVEMLFGKGLIKGALHSQTACSA